jgi:tetratricopeptide (TPR) repeat protein
MELWEIQSERAEAMLLLDEGDLPKARAKLDTLIDQLEPPTTLERRGVMAGCLTDRATVLRFANEWDAALADLDRAELHAQDLFELLRNPLLTGVHLIRAKILSTREAVVFDASAAQRELDALKTLKPLAALGADSWIIHELESHVAFQRRDWKTAAEKAQLAATELDQQQWPRGAAACRRRAGEALLELDMLPAAEGELNRALEFFERRGPADLLSETRLALARVESRRGAHDKAWTLATQALDEMESRLRRFRDVREQQQFVRDKLRFYDFAFDIGLEAQGDVGCARAWNIAERAKSFYLAQLLANADVPLFEGVDPELIGKLERAEAELDECERLLSRLTIQDRGGSKETALGARFVKALASRSTMLRRLMHENPKWLALRNPPPFDVEHFLQRLPDPWVPLSYFWRTERDATTLHIFTIDSKRRPLHSAVLWDPDDRRRLEKDASYLRAPVGLPPLDFADDMVDQVFPATLRKRVPSKAHILLSPHGLLRGLPLHALRVGNTFLGERWPIQYTPGLGLARAQAARGAATSALLVGCVQDGFRNPRLQDVEREIDELGKLWRAASHLAVTALVAADGTLDAAGCPSRTWGNFEILHFACHGAFPEGRPFDAALLIGSEAVRGSEIFAVKLNARVVALSACSLGRHARRWGDAELVGEEWIGLYLPLFYAGARSLVVSLWDADSSTAVKFMLAFHGALAKGADVSTAFQMALSAMKNTFLPLWANWCLVGFPELESE